jgi:branched-chain amino acid transport system ATP-binding protein
MAEAAELVLEGVSLHFGGLAVLTDVSLEARSPELLALIGPNGAGKTSILNCISGIYPPSAGSIRLNGADIIGRKPHVRAAMGLARTFQHGELFPQLSVLENLLIGRHAHMRGSVLSDGLFLPSTRRRELAQREAIEKILDFTELSRYRHDPVSALPLGLQKIVGFARALAMEPKVLMLDEPSAGLNRDGREDLARYILRIKHELGIAMIWVEHDMQMVADLSDRIYVLNNGRYLVDGAPEQVLRDPRVVAAYLGGTVSAD